MDWVQEHCDRLRYKLQAVADGDGARTNKGCLKIPWSWVCRSMIETVKRYPFGLTEAVILAELELLWRRDVRGAFVPGKLQAYLDAQYAPLSDVIQAEVVRHADQLVTLVEDHSGGLSHGFSPTMVDMYLHQNFKSCRGFVEQAGHDLLAPGRKVRLTSVRMLTGASVGWVGSGSERGRRASGTAGSTLFLTEYLAFVLDHRKSDDVKLAADAFGQTHVKDTFDENANQDPYFVVCKVVEIRRPRQHQDRTSGALRRRRRMVQTIVLECAAAKSGGEEERFEPTQASVADDGDRETILLHLWDEQMCLASLFRKGDGLAIYWPWVMQSDVQEVNAGGCRGLSQPHSVARSSQAALVNGGVTPGCGWHYEYGSATAFFVLPRESRLLLLAAANGKTQIDEAIGGAAAAPDGSQLSIQEMTTATGGLCVEDVPADENGIRDLRQFPRRISVADIAPNMVNLSLYGQVVSVRVPNDPLPAVLPPLQPPSDNHSQSNMSHLQQRPLTLLPPMVAAASGPRVTGGVQVVEVGIRDASGETRVLCCGREAITDALTCRPGHFVLACGLRTLTRAMPLVDLGRGGNVVVLCGETDEAREGGATGNGFPSERRLSGDSGGESGSRGLCRILNASCLEGLLQCPFLSRHPLLHAHERGQHGPPAAFVCKVAVTGARWAFAGDGLWAVHRPCRTRLPCHYRALGASASSTFLAGTKRSRDVHEPEGARNAEAREARVSCSLCKCSVKVSSADEAALRYAPLLLALDDGSRCILAECRGEVVASAFAGIHAHVFLHMNRADRRATLDALIGREIRCIVGANGTGSDMMAPEGEGFGTEGASYRSGEITAGMKEGDWSSECTGAKYRVERIASTNPAADLSHALS